MKWSFASVGLIMLGLFGIVIIMLFNDITVSNEQDYSTLKYATEASMLESVDIAYYRLTGRIKISQEKFVENFTRRFTETSTFGQGNYGIEYFQINEYPAKVSLRVYDKTSGYNIYTYNSNVETTQPDIVNDLSAILDGNDVDQKKDGYELIGSVVTSTDDADCVPASEVGKDKDNNEVYRCIFPDGTSEYRDIHGHAVEEKNIVFDIGEFIQENMAETEANIEFIGTLRDAEDVHVFKFTYPNGQVEYKTENGETVAYVNIHLLSPNYNKCTTTTVVGKVKNTDILVIKCNLSEHSYEYQDAYGHLVKDENIEFK